MAFFLAIGLLESQLITKHFQSQRFVAGCGFFKPLIHAQEFTARLHSQLQAVEADVTELCRAAWAAGPGPGTPMAQV